MEDANTGNSKISSFCEDNKLRDKLHDKLRDRCYLLANILLMENQIKIFCDMIVSHIIEFTCYSKLFEIIRNYS